MSINARLLSYSLFFSFLLLGNHDLFLLLSSHILWLVPLWWNIKNPKKRASGSMSQIVLVDRCLKYQIQWNKGWLGLSLQRQMELLLKLQSGIHSRGIQYSLLYEALAPEWWTLGEVTTYCGSESASERTKSGNIGQNSFFIWLDKSCGLQSPLQLVFLTPILWGQAVW